MCLRAFGLGLKDKNDSLGLGLETETLVLFLVLGCWPQSLDNSNTFLDRALILLGLAL